MRKIILLLMGVSFCSLISCQEDKVVEVNEKQMRGATSKAMYRERLCFSSLEDMNDTLSMLMQKASDEQAEWCKSKGFKSLEMLYIEALDELEEIQNSISYSIYKEKYKAFREKYSSYFLFNDKDTSDLSPYIASNSTYNALVADVNGFVTIGDTIININDIKSFERLNYGKADLSFKAKTKAADGATIVEETNSLYVKYEKRKMWAEIENLKGEVYIKYSAHKKGIFGGWNKYRTTYSTKHLDHVPSSWLNVSDWLNYLAGIVEYDTTPECPSGTRIRIGATPSALYPERKAYALFRIYSRGVGEENAGILEVNI